MAPCGSFLTAQQIAGEIAKNMYQRLEEGVHVFTGEIKEQLVYYLTKFGVRGEDIEKYLGKVTSQKVISPEEGEEFLKRATENSNIELLFVKNSEE